MTSVEEAASDRSSSMEQITSRDCSNGASTSDEINRISGDLDVVNELEISKRNTDDAEIISSDVTQKSQEVSVEKAVIDEETKQEPVKVHGNDIEESLNKISEVKDSEAVNGTEAKDNAVVQDHQDITEVVDTSRSQETGILRNSEAAHSVEEGSEIKEEEERKTVDVQEQESDEHRESCSLELKDGSRGRQESVEVQSGESEEFQDAEPETFLIDKRGSKHVFEEISSDIGLKDVTEDQNCVEKEELKDDKTKVDEIEELQKPSIEVSSEESEETSTKVDKKIKEKPEEEEEVRLQQESHGERSYEVETKEETQSVPEAVEKAQEEEETKLQKVETEKHDSATEEVSNAQLSPVEEKPDEVTQGSSVSALKKGEDEIVVEADRENEAEQAEDKTQKSLEIVETAESHSSLAEDQEHETVFQQTEDEKVKQTETTDDLSVPLEASRLEDKEIRETEYLESLSSSKTTEDVPVKEEEELRNLEAVKLEESKEDKSLEILETSKAIDAKSDQSLVVETSQEDQTPKEVKEIHKEETVEANKLEAPVDQILSSEIVSGLDDQTPKQVDEIHEEEAKNVNELEVSVDQSLPVETRLVDQTLSSERVSGLDDQNPKEVKEIHDEETMEANKVESMADLSLQVETSQVDQSPPSELVSELNGQTPKQIKETHKQETKEAHKLEAMTDQSLPVEASQADQTPFSEIVSGLDEQTPKLVKEIHEEETKEAEKLVVAGDESLLIETPQEHQTSSSELVPELEDKTAKKDEEIHEEETKEEHKLEVVSDRSLPVAALQAEHISSSELVSTLEDDTPKQVEEIHDEDTNEAQNLEAVGDRSFAIETSQEDQTPSSELVSKLDDQTPKEVEEYKVAEIDGSHKLESTTDRSLLVETSKADQTTASELVSKLDDETPKQFDETLQQFEEIHEEEAKKAYELEVTSDQSLPVETSKADQTPSSELVSELNSQTPKQIEEIHEEETEEALKFVVAGDQSLPVEALQAGQTPSSEVKSELDEQTPNKVEEIHEEETKETPKLVETIHEEEAKDLQKLEVTGEQNLPVEALQVDQTPSSDLVSELDDRTPKQVEEIHEEETKEGQELEAPGDQSLPVDISQADQTPLSESVSGLDDQTPKQVEEIQEEETKQAPKLQAEEIPITETIPREAPVSMLASREDEQVTLQESNGASEVKETDDIQEDKLVSAETEENVGEAKPKELETEGTENSEDQAETLSYPLSLEKETHEDDTYSTLPVVGILKELQTTLETDRATEDSALSGENMRSEPAEEVEKTEATEKYFEPSFEAELETAEKHPVTDISESVTVEKQGTTSAEEGPAAEEFEASVEEKLQEEEEAKEIRESPVDRSLTEALPCEKILLATSAVLSEEPEHVLSAENQEEHKAKEDADASTVEKTNLQEEHSRDFETSLKVDDVSDQIIEAEVPAGQPRTLHKPESHETVEKDQISDIKEEESHSVLRSEVEIDAVITPEKEITEPSESLEKANEAEHESSEEHVEPQAISDVTKRNDDSDSIPVQQAPKDPREEVDTEEEKTKKLEGHDREENTDEFLTKEAPDEQLQVPSSEFSSKEKEQVAEAVENSDPETITDIADQETVVQKPSEIIQSQSPNLRLEEKVEETSFEVTKIQEDKDMENVDDVAIKENMHVQDQPKEFEVAASNEDTNVKLEVHDDKLGGDDLEEHSIVALKEETDLIEEKREVKNMNTEPEDAIKHGIDQQISVPLIATDKALEIKEEKEEPENIQSTEENHKDEINKVSEQSQDLIVSSEGKEIIKDEVSGEEKSDTYEKIDQSSISEATKEIYQEETKQTDTFTAFKEETREEKNLAERSEEIPAEKKTQDTMVLQKETAQECLNNKKNIDETTEEKKSEVQNPESLSSISTTQDKLQETEELQQEISPRQQPREIAHEVKQENLKIAGDGESKEAEKDLFSELKDSESTVKEPARKSLSDLIHKLGGVKVTSKVEHTTASHIEEETKTEEEEDGEEHKEDKTSPDSIVMVEAKDTANMNKTPHKKSHGILSGVGSKVKSSISKVKKAITGKSSHTKPSSPQ